MNKKEGKKLIEEEPKQVITEWMDDMGVPCEAYERVLKRIVNKAVIFALKWCKPAFEYWYSEFE